MHTHTHIYIYIQQHIRVQIHAYLDTSCCLSGRGGVLIVELSFASVFWAHAEFRALGLGLSLGLRAWGLGFGGSGAQGVQGLEFSGFWLGAGN